MTLIGPHCDTFSNGLGTIVEVQALFSQHFKEGKLDNWALSFIHDEAGLSVSNQYFQHVSDTLPEDVMSLENEVDPCHTLADAVEDGFVHTSNNHVEYYEHIKDDKGTPRYEFDIPFEFGSDTEIPTLVTSMSAQHYFALEIL